MQLRNDRQNYGLIAILLHWSMAILIFEQFFLGKYMVDLDYLHPWYNSAPDLHRSFGVLVALLLIVRWFWRLTNPVLRVEGPHWEQRLALWIHRVFYVLIAGAVLSGYLLSTADGQGVAVFDLFNIGAVYSGGERQENLAAETHEWLTNVIFFLALLHAAAALKHHFLDRDDTLRRMLGLSSVRRFLEKTPNPEGDNP